MAVIIGLLLPGEFVVVGPGASVGDRSCARVGHAVWRVAMYWGKNVWEESGLGTGRHLAG